MKDIFELTKSELLLGDHTEKEVPTPIHSLVQMKNYQIIAATEETLYVIDYIKKRNAFDIIREIKLKVNGVFQSLIDIGNNLLLASTVFQGFVINLNTDKIILELGGRCPIPLKDGRISYIVNEEIIRITKMNEVGEDEEIPIKRAAINPDKDTTEMNFIQDGIQLKNGNILLISYDKTITEYDIIRKQCVQIIETSIILMESCYELKDGRIGITAMDNGNIFLINTFRYKSDNILKLTGHTNTVIKILQLENEQIISSSYDGNVKIWYKLKDGNFNCAMTLHLFNDYIKAFLLMDDGRILITGDDKTLRALGVQNHIGNFTIEFKPEDKKTKAIKSFQLIDNRIP
jgi:WD40 repeat protein